MPRGGVRPNSGRKTILEEGRINDLIKTSVAVTQQFLSDTSIPLERRAEIASRVAAKRIPNDVNIGGQPDNPINVVTLQWEK